MALDSEHSTEPSIVPVVMCGGVGTRLWPMSRSQSPKQFHPVDGKGTLTFFQTTIQRHRGSLYQAPLVVTSMQHMPQVRRQLSELQCKADVIGESVARNTGPAVLAAALHLAKTDPKALMLVLPSDHIITGDFDSVIRRAAGPARNGQIIMFGIVPDYPETGYGYIVDGGDFVTHPGLRSVAKFVEKPPLAEAEALIASGAAFWASGISLFSVQTIIDEFRAYDATTFEAVKTALARAEERQGEVHLEADAFRRATNEPTERIVFERSDRVILAPADIDWNDVGCWTSVHAVGDSDDKGNVFSGDVIATNTENALVRADDRLVALVGVPGVIVIDTPDAVLVTRQGECQDVKKVVEMLKSEERKESVQHKSREHAWGTSVNLMRSAGYDMSVLKIRAGTSLELDPIPGRKLIPMKGAIDVFDGIVRRTITVGENFALESRESGRISNRSDRTAEVLMVTLTSFMFDDGDQADLTRHAS